MRFAAPLPQRWMRASYSLPLCVGLRRGLAGMPEKRGTNRATYPRGNFIAFTIAS